jgi:hypothetical protein
VEQGNRAWSSGYLEIRSAAGFTGDPLTLGWVPDQQTAMAYRAMASFDRTVPSAFGGNFRKVVVLTAPYPAANGEDQAPDGARYHMDIPVTLALEISASHAGAHELQVYDNGNLLHTVHDPPAGQPFSIRVQPDGAAGSNAVWIELAYPDGNVRTSHVLWLVSDSG